MTARELKLSPGQAAFLRQVAAVDAHYTGRATTAWVADIGRDLDFRPLVKRELINVEFAPALARAYWRHTITDLGRAALAAHEGGAS